MSSLTKTQKEESMDLKIDKALDEINLKARKLTNKFNNRHRNNNRRDRKNKK